MGYIRNILHFFQESYSVYSKMAGSTEQIACGRKVVATRSHPSSWSELSMVLASLQDMDPIYGPQ